MKEPNELTTLTASTDELYLPIAQIISPLTKDDMQRLDRFYPATLVKIAKNERLDAQDIIHMTRAGVADPSIIEIIDRTNSVFYLSQVNEQELRQAGVSKKVISVMQKTTEF
jgi:hypothetical protein